MIAANGPGRGRGKLMKVDSEGTVRHFRRRSFAELLGAGDVVVVNDAGTLPASLHGTHAESGRPIELRLAGWLSDLHDTEGPQRFLAVVFGKGDYRTLTEDRAAPPPWHPGDHFIFGSPGFGSLEAVVELRLDHERLIPIRFRANRGELLAGLACHGRPIQYAHVPDRLHLWDVWTSVAAEPIAFEAPSAGFAIDWRTLARWRERGVNIVSLSHAAGISSTGDDALDAALPFDEPYEIPAHTAHVINDARANGGRVVAMGTTVLRALESAAHTSTGSGGAVQAGRGIARVKIGPETNIRVVDVILTGMHEPGESHYELLRAFAKDSLLQCIHTVASRRGYRGHEFGDSLLLERAR